MSDEPIAAGIVNFDFQRVFPHKFWVSNWLADEAYPTGVCYKVLSIRDEQANLIQLVLLRSFRDGTKEILHRAEVPLVELENAVHVIVDGLTQKLNLNFEEQNFEGARTLTDFRKITSQYGWDMRSLDASSNDDVLAPRASRQKVLDALDQP